jgi:hypothetical protein
MVVVLVAGQLAEQVAKLCSDGALAAALSSCFNVFFHFACFVFELELVVVVVLVAGQVAEQVAKLCSDGALATALRVAVLLFVCFHFACFVLSLAE